MMHLMLNGLQRADLFIFALSEKSVSAVLTGMEPTGTGETKKFLFMSH